MRDIIVIHGGKVISDIFYRRVPTSFKHRTYQKGETMLVFVSMKIWKILAHKLFFLHYFFKGKTIRDGGGTAQRSDLSLPLLPAAV